MFLMNFSFHTLPAAWIQAFTHTLANHKPPQETVYSFCLSLAHLHLNVTAKHAFVLLTKELTRQMYKQPF